MTESKNPFVFGLAIPAYPKSDREKLSINVSDSTSKDVSKSNVTLERKYWVETTPCTKMYHTKDMDEIIDALDSKSVKLLFYIMRKLPYGSDRIRLETKAMMNVLHLKSRAMLYQARNALIAVNVIAPTLKTGDYWINPHYIFNGSRVKTYPDNIVNIYDSKYKYENENE